MPPKFITPDQLLRRVRGQLDAFAQSGRASLTEHLGREPICAEGCATCCHFKVLVDVAQGALIALFLLRTGRWGPDLIERLRAADAEMTPVSHTDFARLRRPCVFLDVEGPGRGSCSVYPVRPFGCAGTFGGTLDPADCGPDLK